MNRIEGLDLARAFAIFGMVLVNFKNVLIVEGGAEHWYWLAALFEGRASAVFVMLAGIGIGLGFASKNRAGLASKEKQQIAKRGLLLFVIGLLFVPIWPADILHFYGLYFLIAIGFLAVPVKGLFISAFILILAYPLALQITDYDTAWDFTTLEYQDFWTMTGFARNTFINGFHPIWPWLSYLLIGLALVKMELTQHQVRRQLLKWSATVAVTTELLSRILISQLGDPLGQDVVDTYLTTQPMPPTPLYMIAASATAIALIMLCIEFCLWRANSQMRLGVTKLFQQVGQLSLTFYFLHVILGMGVMEELGLLTTSHSIESVMILTAGYCLFCLVFTKVWLRQFNTGPFEWMFKNLLQK